MARFIFETRVNTREAAVQIQREFPNSEIQYLENCQEWDVSGFVADYDMEGLGLRVMSLGALQSLSVNRVLAEFTAADARRWMKGA